MAVEAVNGNKFFTSRAYTNNGNEYQKSNYGKIAGAAVGIGTAGYVGYKGYNINKQIYPIAEKNGLHTIVCELISQQLDAMDMPLSEKEYAELPQKILKFSKKATKIGAILATAVTGLLFLGIGSMGDSIANFVKRKNVDKKAKVNN